MDDKQLKLLEERINNAITFIETLKAREKTLIEEKKEIEKRAADLQELITEKDKKIDDLSENQLFLKNKIEAVLDKLEGLASLELEGSFTETETIQSTMETEEETADAESEEETIDNDIEDSGEIIVEENIVDLKNEEITDKAEEIEEDEENIIDEEPVDKENLLFDSEA
jgi:hypothetical protein